MTVPFPDHVRRFVESAKWTFAKTYAATWPHEYIVRNDANAVMLLALARHIFDHGVEGRFYSQVRKYHHQDGKAYWSMDDTAEQTTLVNRCDESRPMRPAGRPERFQGGAPDDSEAGDAAIKATLARQE